MTTADQMKQLVKEYNLKNGSTLENQAKEYIEKLIIPKIKELAQSGLSECSMIEKWPKYPKLKSYEDNTFGQPVSKYTKFYTEVKRQLESKPHNFQVFDLLVKW